MKRCLTILYAAILFASCSEEATTVGHAGMTAQAPITADTLTPDNPNAFPIRTAGKSPDSLVQFAHTLMGKPYVYACAKPETGFDCSGFVWYVFQHFGIEVPRSSADFTNVGKEMPLAQAMPADLILFTGTNAALREVGHIGIVVYKDADSLSFIHASSGDAQAVTLSDLDEHYMKRFLKITRVFALK